MATNVLLMIMVLASSLAMMYSIHLLHEKVEDVQNKLNELTRRFVRTESNIEMMVVRSKMKDK